jgi:LAO/AO transport system kinase
VLTKRKSQKSLGILLRRAFQRDRRSIAQLMSIAENDPATAIRILSLMYNRTGRAYIVGITGPPGSGKSTLIAELAKRYAREGHTVGIVAVDPSSQMTGGALLGDRIRMQELASDPHVFIRSMATRGQVGGIARATEDIVRILDATFTEYIFVETVGAGQSDVDIKPLAHTIVVVTAPGLGDEIQALKAGIMEIGDIFVVNKADREDADRSAQEISSMIAMSNPLNGWRPKVVKTSALSGEGLSALFEAISQHAQHVKSAVPLKRDGRKARQLIINAIRRYFDSITLEQLVSAQQFAKLASQVERNKIDPYTAARRILKRTGRQR